MGEYASLYIDGYEIDTWKDHIGSEAAILFTEADAVETEKPYSEETCEADSAYESSIDSLSQKPKRGYQYVSTARHLIERLNLLGYTLERARSHFTRGVAKKIKIVDGL
jgi:HEPN/Toprim N-terminal domain 1